MYPIQCPGGFSVPAKAGKFEVLGFCVTVSDPTADSQFAIVDDSQIKESWVTGRVLTSLDNQNGILSNVKGLANIDTILSYEFSEPVKTRYGISIYGTNLLPGSVCVYRR